MTRPLSARSRLRLTVAGVLAFAAPGPVRAQPSQSLPSQAQIGAIRQACRADYMQFCAAVPTGGGAALQCLQRHDTQLSAACGDAVRAVSQPVQAAPASAAADDLAPLPASAPGAPLWPHTVVQDGVSATIYQPQVLSWPGQKRISVRAAVAITARGAEKPFLGRSNWTATPPSTWPTATWRSPSSR